MDTTEDKPQTEKPTVTDDKVDVPEDIPAINEEELVRLTALTASGSALQP